MKSQNEGLRVVKVVDKRHVRDWLAVPHSVFADDPAWVPPLHFLERRRISPKHAPFFSFGEACLFLAYRGDTAIGRISAQVNRRHLERYQEATGHFGFFDCVDDAEAALALVSAAELWLRPAGSQTHGRPAELFGERGMRLSRIRVRNSACGADDAFATLDRSPAGECRVRERDRPLRLWTPTIANA